MYNKNKVGNTQTGRFQTFVKWAGQHIWLVTIILFILSFAIRLICSFWSGPVVSQIAYPDEIRFFHIAKSIAEQGQILVRDLPTAFQKILYSLFLTPAFMFTNDQLLQVNIIRVINCLLISSSVFPVMLLSKKLTSNKIVLITSLLITVTLPDMAYSATLLSEVLYMPLCVWLFYIAYCVMAEQNQAKRLFFFGIFGLITYLVYLTKEIGAAFLITIILLLVVDGIRNRQCLMQNVLSLLVLSVTFFGAFFVMKLTLFQGMGNTYDTDTYSQISLSALSSPDVFFYLIYSFIVLFMASALSFYVAPIFFALYGYRGMNEQNKKILLFSFFSLIIMIGAITYTISIREDIGELVPRLHMRYVAPLIIPLMIQCLDFLFTKATIKPSKRFTKVFLAIIVVFCIALIFFIPHGPKEDTFFDHFTLKSTLPVELFTVYIGSTPINMLFMLFKLLLMALTIYYVFVIIKKRTKNPVIILLLCTLFIVNSYDNFMCYTSIRRAKTSDFSKAYFLDESASYLELAFCEEGLQFSNDIVDALISTNDYLKTLDGTAIVVMSLDFASYTDTYLEPKAFPVQAGELYRRAVSNGGFLRLDKQPISEGNRYFSSVLGLDTWKCGVFSADYIITLAEDHPFANVKVEYEKRPFVILRNLDPAIIYIDME